MIDVAAYHRDGFTSLPIFSAEEVSALAVDVDRFTASTSDQAWPGGWIDDFNMGRQHTLKAMHDIHRRSDTWQRAVTKPKLIAAVEALLGGPAKLNESTLIVKPAKSGQPFPVHQDAYYYGNGIPSVLATVYLDDATDENGPVRFLPGLHTQGRLPHERKGGGKAHMNREQYPVEQTVEVPARAGDVVFFSIYTPHASYPNRSDQPRRTVRLWYAAA